MKGYRDLVVWQKGMVLAEQVYALAKLMPREEQYRMTSQVLRSVASVPANLAEGYQRGTRKDYAHFVSIAQGSLAETQTYLELASRVGLLSAESMQAALDSADEVSRMLYALRKRLAAQPLNPEL